MKTVWRNIALLAALAGLAGCDQGTGPEDPAEVAVAFRASVASPAPSPMASASPTLARSVVVEGSGGTLAIDELYVIVAEFELKRVSDDHCAEEDDACEKFEAPPTFVQVPLDGGRSAAVTGTVEPGTYDELDFEIEDLDDDDDEDGQATAQLLGEIRARFPDWPRDASLLVIGTFTPTGGSATPFRVYFEAEVEVELDLAPPVIVPADGDALFTVELDPARWFVDGLGRVRNLALLDFAATGRVAELEVEVENGFVSVEFDD